MTEGKRLGRGKRNELLEYEMIGCRDRRWHTFTFLSILCPPGGGGVLPYMGYIGMCCSEGYGFQAVYKSENLGLE